MAGGQIGTYWPCVGGPREVQPQDERPSLLHADPTTESVLEAQARAVQLGVRREVGPQAPKSAKTALPKM